MAARRGVRRRPILSLAVLAIAMLAIAVILPPGLPAGAVEIDAAAAVDATALDAAPGEAVAPAEETGIRRPLMRQIGPLEAAAGPPSRRAVADGRAAVRRRFRAEFSHTATAAGARLAAETLLSAALTEPDRTLRWVLLDEARRLGESSGQAGIVSRSFAAAAGTYDFDDVAGELRSLEQIPVRALDGGRAAALAKAAEQLAARAAGDNRLPQAIAAEGIAVRAWQRAGNSPAAREAASRTTALERRSIRD